MRIYWTSDQITENNRQLNSEQADTINKWRTRKFAMNNWQLHNINP